MEALLGPNICITKLCATNHGLTTQKNLCLQRFEAVCGSDAAVSGKCLMPRPEQDSIIWMMGSVSAFVYVEFLFVVFCSGTVSVAMAFLNFSEYQCFLGYNKDKCCLEETSPV